MKRKNKEILDTMNDIIYQMQSGIAEIRQLKREIENLTTSSIVYEIGETIRKIKENWWELELIRLKEKENEK